MKKTLRIVFLILLVTIAFCSAIEVCHADTVSYSSNYTQCTVYMNGKKLSTPGSTLKGNIYIDTDTILKYGNTDGWTFDYSGSNLLIDSSKLDIYLGDSITTSFVQKNAGTIYFQLKYFSTSYTNKYMYYLSLGSIADIARLEWTYKDGCVYIRQYENFETPFVLTKGSGFALTDPENEESTIKLEENKLLSLTEYGDEYIKAEDTAGNLFYINPEDANLIEDSAEVHSYKRCNKEKDVYDEAINAMWSDLSYCPEKVAGIDVLADISFFPTGSGASYYSCNSKCDYGVIQEAKNRGYIWWLCAQNFNTSNGATYDYIDTLLKDRRTSKELAARYILYTCLYNADGINIDFEEMGSSCRNYFIYFMQTLCKHCDKLGITTSVCTYYGSPWNNSYVYPFDIFGQCCDFICEMVYNEDISSSLSAMSKPYYEAGTNYIASLAPRAKILMGVADYTRYSYWSGSTLAGTIWLSLNGVWDDTPGMVISWDDYTGQYYAEQPYVRYGVEYLAKFYIEDARSSALKAQYIVDNGYGGTIGWTFSYTSLAFGQVRDMFKAYDDVYHQGKTYEDYINYNPME